MGIEVTGLKEIQKNLANLPAQIETQVLKSLGEYGVKMQQNARRIHRYNSLTGHADRSIEMELNQSPPSMMFYIDNELTSCDGKWANVSYVTFQDQGTGKGYRQSKGAEAYTPTGFKTGFGIKYDHFMARSWDKYLSPMLKEIKKRVISTVKAAI